MKKFKVLLLSTVILIISGCAIAPAADPQEVIKEMITNMQNLTASTFSVESTLKQDDPETGTSVDAKINVSGKSNLLDGDVPSASLEINIAIDTKDTDKGDMNGTVKFLITVAESNVYFKLDELTLPEELQNQIESFVSLYKGNWYKFPSELLPDDVKDSLTAEDTDNTKKEQVQALLRNANLFDVIKSSVENGQYVYKSLINQENLKTLAQDISRAEGVPITETDFEMFDAFFDDYAHDIILYINKDSRYLDKVDLAISSNNTDEQLDVSVTATFSKHNEAQNIAAPADAQDFNPMGLMGLGMILEGSQGTSLGEDTGSFEDLDLSELEEMNMEEFEKSMEEFEEDSLEEDLDSMME